MRTSEVGSEVTQMPPMTEFERLMAFRAEQEKKAVEIMIKKNHDYSGENDEDPLKNFNDTANVVNISAEQGFLVRIMDKMNRLGNFFTSGVMKVKDESVEDTILDAINYMWLMAYRIKQRKS